MFPPVMQLAGQIASGGSRVAQARERIHGPGGGVERERRRPYWLAGGTERCAACEQGYVLEMECRCVACDAGICVVCVAVVRETRETFCPGCYPEVT